MSEKGHLQVTASLLKYPSFTVAAITAAGLAYFCGLQLRGNLQVVSYGSLYRSAQPSNVDLKRYTHDLGIRSVVNLRLDDSDKVEQEATSNLGVTYFHVPLAADQLWSARQIKKVMTVLAEAPKPILVHSQFGADRAGLVSAIYLLLIERRPITEARNQLSLRYGHMAYFGSPTGAMDDTFEAVASLYDRREGSTRD